MDAKTQPENQTNQRPMPNAQPLGLLHANPEGEARPVDLLFVHGISAGAWIWNDGVLDHFARAGYRAWALDLAGRGANAAEGDIDRFSLADFADDLATALDEIARPTVVIAHSLGGAVVQRLLAGGRQTAGTVLLCSVPPYGLWRASMEMALRHPRLWQQMAVFSFRGIEHTDFDVMRRGLFPSGIEETVFDRIAARLQNESARAMRGTSGWPPFAPPPLSQRNMLVIGGGRDAFVPPADVLMTGAYYGVLPHIVAEGGHMMMYETAGLEAARIILDWLPRVEESAAA